jgi:nucleoid-associated protein YgaU
MVMAGEKTGINWIWVAAAAVAVAAAVGGGLQYRSMTQAPAPTVAPAEVAIAVAPVVEPIAPALAAPENPTFDTVRVEPDGSALVAGQGPAGASLRVIVDGIETASGLIDGSGKFATLFDLPSSSAPRLMTLEAVMPDGTVIASKDSVAIAPTVPPVVVAGVEPEPATEPAAEVVAQTPATLLVTEGGASVMQAPTVIAEPGQPFAVSIDTISYAPDGAVQLSGQAAAGAFVRLYLDNSELMLLTAPANGPWSATLPDVPPGIYTLRADQIGADGKVASRFETPFKRETPEALAEASAPLPEPEPDVVASVEATIEPAPAIEQTPSVVPLAPSDPAIVPDPVVEATPPEPERAVTAPDPAVPPVAEDPAVVASIKPASPAAPVTMTVQPGFSLWKIARENYGDGVMYVQVFDANRDKIKDPDLIYPGQVFTMPAMP